MKMTTIKIQQWPGTV